MAHEVNVREFEVDRTAVDDDSLVTDGSMKAIAPRQYLGQKIHG
ncbi:hypothetical protein [Mycolicibacterium parafortuitum]|nr:hypothetical protein [Mycolicibacterium parafortuitum]